MVSNTLYSWNISLLVIVTHILLLWTFALGINAAELAFPLRSLNQTNLKPSRDFNETNLKSVIKERFGIIVVDDAKAIDVVRRTNRRSNLNRSRLRRRITTETAQSSSSPWLVLNLIVQYGNTQQQPSSGVSPGDIVVTNNNIFNLRNQVVGNVQQSCIRSTNFVCTWTVFSASIASTGCDIYLQGLFIPASSQVFSTPILQTAAITGGTGPCRGIRGEALMSIRQLQANTILLWDFILTYRIPY
jgi:hypothetical protein